MKNSAGCVHWCKIPLDKYSSLWIRNINTDTHKCIYKTLDAEGRTLESEKEKSFIILKDAVVVGSVFVELDAFQYAVKTLCTTSESIYDKAYETV